MILKEFCVVNETKIYNHRPLVDGCFCILRDDNTGIIKVTKEINKLYEAAASTQGEYVENTKGWIDFDKYLGELPQEMWLW